MKQYLDLMRKIVETGDHSDDRTGIGTIKLFGTSMRFNDVGTNFPLLTTKNVNFATVIKELLWFISGSTNTEDLDSSIWDDWAVKEDNNLSERHTVAKGELGPIYGKMWRSWPAGRSVWAAKNSGDIDQLEEVIHTLKINPTSRRMIVSSWNPEFLPDERFPPHRNAVFGKQALPPCHCLFQFSTSPATQTDKYNWSIANGHYTGDSPAIAIPELKVHCQMYQRSSDFCLGVPFNIASYSLLLKMIAQVTDMIVGDFIWVSGDTHIYKNHLDGVKEQLSRTPHGLNTIQLSKNVKNINDFKLNDIRIIGPLKPQPAIKFEIAV